MLINSSICFDKMNLGGFIVYIKGSQVRISNLKFLDVLQPLKNDFFFILANSADSNEMPHYAVFHCGPHCLSCNFTASRIQRVG